jgi:hypothetical protein
MTQTRHKGLIIAGSVLVALMAVLQAVYALLAYLDPASFATVRGTALVDAADADWVHIYASRTLFVALIIALLLFKQSFALLKWAALIGLVMPITDAFLACAAQAPTAVVGKHVATAVYLLATFGVLHLVVSRQRPS